MRFDPTVRANSIGETSGDYHHVTEDASENDECWNAITNGHANEAFDTTLWPPGAGNNLGPLTVQRNKHFQHETARDKRPRERGKQREMKKNRAQNANRLEGGCVGTDNYEHVVREMRDETLDLEKAKVALQVGMKHV